MILCFSGGVDSYIAWHYLGTPPTVYFQLGTKYSIKEQKVVEKLIPNTIIDFSLDLESRELPNSYVPFRNLHLALLASKYDHQIIIVGLKDDMVEDKTPSAFGHMTACMNSIEKDKDYFVTSPFWHMTKEEIVAWYMKTVGDVYPLLRTVSCYSEEDTNYCGKCPSCFRKWVAFRSNRIEIEFYNHPLMKEYVSKARQGIYNEKRNIAILREVERYGYTY